MASNADYVLEDENVAQESPAPAPEAAYPEPAEPAQPAEPVPQSTHMAALAEIARLEKDMADVAKELDGARALLAKNEAASDKTVFSYVIQAFAAIGERTKYNEHKKNSGDDVYAALYEAFCKERSSSDREHLGTAIARFIKPPRARRA